MPPGGGRARSGYEFSRQSFTRYKHLTRHAILALLAFKISTCSKSSLHKAKEPKMSHLKYLLMRACLRRQLQGKAMHSAWLLRHNDYTDSGSAESSDNPCWQPEAAGGNKCTAVAERRHQDPSCTSVWKSSK